MVQSLMLVHQELEFIFMNGIVDYNKCYQQLILQNKKIIKKYNQD